MFDFFKKDKQKQKNAPLLADLDQKPLKEGDLVQSLRYDLGTCRLIKTEEGLFYESLENGKRVSWAYMVDAATELQKVKKLEEDQA